ncbi:hypothetical protein LCGC14_0310780 [marine sediment metagenome]|uniref:EF-hand domain-containing protein n=1 Tax=marine sediment metagenome TaxID=412755 RepID=A0A0F9TMC0_9ZZZZ
MTNLIVAMILAVSTALPVATYTSVSAVECADNRPTADFNGDGTISILDVMMSADQRGLNYTLKHVAPYFGLLVCED